MQIMLLSNGLYTPEAQKRFMGIVNESNLERRAIIVTTTEPDNGPIDHQADHTREVLEGLGFEATVLNAAAEGTKRLAEYPVIYLSDGDPFALLNDLKKSGTDQILRDLHEKGHFIVGHSAGAAVLGLTIEHLYLLNAEVNTTDLTDFSGLGLVPAVILPLSNRYEEREPALKLMEFMNENAEELINIEDDLFYVYEQLTPEMRSNPEIVLRKLEDAGLAKYREDIAKLLFNSLKMELNPTAETNIPVGTSKVGGGADLPQGTAWLEWSKCAYTFIAQINLAELPTGHGLPLPQSGLLSFFYASAEMYKDFEDGFYSDPTTCKVIYTPPHQLEALRRLPVPLSLLEEDPPVVLAPNTIRFIPNLCIPDSDSAHLEVLGLGWDGNRTEHERYWRTFYGSLNEHHKFHRSIHRLGGYPDSIQGDMQLDCAKMPKWGTLETFNAEEDEAEFRRDALNWRLLLQIDSDDATGIDWGDTGRIYFWIREKELQEMNFANVVCIMQC